MHAKMSDLGPFWGVYTGLFVPSASPESIQIGEQAVTLTARSTRKNPTRYSPAPLEPNDQNLAVERNTEWFSTCR